LNIEKEGGIAYPHKTLCKLFAVSFFLFLDMPSFVLAHVWFFSQSLRERRESARISSGNSKPSGSSKTEKQFERAKNFSGTAFFFDLV
jgi:hypothetical protein